MAGLGAAGPSVAETAGNTAAGRNIPALTGIRGVAALWVVLYHLHEFARFDPRFAFLDVALVREGFRGVDLFFVLSGFILMHVHRDDFRHLGQGAVARFFLARFWRVYPLNAAVLLLMIALYLALPGFHGLAALDPAGIAQSFALAQRWFMPDFGSINGPAWSLSVEILGYAAFPALAFALNRVVSNRVASNHAAPRPALLLIAAACLALLIAVGLLLGFAFHNMTGRSAVVRMFPGFVAGAALAAFHAAGGAVPRPAGARRGGLLATASLAGCLVLCSVPSLAFLAPVPIAGLVLGLASEGGAANRLLASRPAVWLGEISFSLYLTNLVVIDLAVWLSAGRPGTGGAASGAAFAAATLLAVLAVAAAVHRLVERPAARLGRRLIAASGGRRPAAAPSPTGADPTGPSLAPTGAASRAG